MPIFVRTIEATTWRKTAPACADEVCADAITGTRGRGLGTLGNTLSVWEIPHEGELEKAILAIVSGYERLETVDVVMLDRSAIEAAGIRIQNNTGRTPFKEFENKHHDLLDLNYKSLGQLAGLIVSELDTGRVKRVRLAEAEKLVRKAIAGGTIHPENLKESMRAQIA